MSDRLNERADGDLDPQFLVQFADEALLKALVWLTLAAREFPQATQMGIGETLGNQELAIAEDEACGHVDDGGCVRNRRFRDGRVSTGGGAQGTSLRGKPTSRQAARFTNSPW